MQHYTVEYFFERYLKVGEFHTKAVSELEVVAPIQVVLPVLVDNNHQI